MTEARQLYLLGLSHRSASVDVRERVALDPQEKRSRLEVVQSLDGIEEAWILSTCNRTEVLVRARAKRGKDAQAAERERVLGLLRDVLFREAPDDALYAHGGIEAVVHVFRVSSGLDSLVLGESQILAQVKEAYGLAREAGTTGPWLEPLLQQALAIGKRVRTETRVGQGTLSVARAGVDVATQVFGRHLGEVRAIVVGSGETGRLVARHLCEHGLRKLRFANRTLASAEEAARELDCSAMTLDHLEGVLAEADLVVTCVDGAPNLLTPDSFRDARLGRRDRPMVVIDLSVPRAVHPDIGELGSVLSYDLDDIARVVEANQRERQLAAEEAAPLLLSAVHKFLGLRSYASMTPVIERLKERFDAGREGTLDAVAGEHAAPEMVELAHRLTRHLLDVALDQLKENARDSVSPESVDRAYQRFREDT